MKKLMTVAMMLVACAVSAVDYWESRLTPTVQTLVQTNHNITPGTAIALPNSMREIKVQMWYTGTLATTNGYLRSRIVASYDQGTNFWDSPANATLTIVATNSYPAALTNGASGTITGAARYLRVAEITNGFQFGPVSNMVFVVSGVRE